MPDHSAALEDVKDDSNYIFKDTALEREPGEETPVFSETSSVSNPYARRRFNKNEDGTRGEFSGYFPNKRFIRAASIRQLPRYLFRAVCQGSRGLNREGHYKSHALHAGLGRHDFFKLNDGDIKKSLYDHVSQTNCDSHWISFTDSIDTVMGRAGQFIQHDKEDIDLHIVDTFNIKNKVLIVHSYAMLRGYRVCVGRAEEQQKKLLGSAYAEFLVWDELVAEAGSVPVKHLLWTGLLKLLPELVIPPDTTEQVDEQRKRKLKFKQPGVLRKQLYSVELKLKDRATLRDQYYSGPRQEWKWKERAGRFPVKNKDLPPVEVRERDDPRGLLSTHVMNRFRAMVACIINPRFQLVLLVALLSMKTNTFCREDMAQQLATIPLDEYKSAYIEFFRTPINTREKRDVQVFQELFTRFIIYARGNLYVKYVHHVKRTLVWLDRPETARVDPETDDASELDSSQAVVFTSRRHGLLTKTFLETSDDAGLGKRKRHNVQAEKRLVSKKRKLNHQYHDTVSTSPTPSLATSYGTADTARVGTPSPPTPTTSPDRVASGAVQGGVKEVGTIQEGYVKESPIIETSDATIGFVEKIEPSAKVKQAAKQKAKQHSTPIRKPSKAAQKKEETRRRQEQEAKESLQRQRDIIQQASGAKKLSWMK